MPPASPPPSFRSHGLNHAIAVGCTDPVAATTSRGSNLGGIGLTIETGTLGAWESGTDSSGNPAADLAVSDSAGDHITVPISFDLG